MNLAVMNSFVNNTDVNITEEAHYVALTKKDVKHFYYFYDKYYDRIFSFIYRRTADENTTADIASNVFFKALENISKFELGKIPFSAYLYRIAINETAQYFRDNSKQRFVSIDNVTDIDDLFDNENGGYSEEELKMLESTLKKLNTEEIEYIEMRFFERKSFKTIADIKDITENNAKVKTYRILDKLKAMILKSTSHE